MAVDFIVETGAGLATSTTYISEADMDQYWENRGYTVFAGTSEEKQALLNRATTIIDGQYFSKYKGYRSSETQALQWPRSSIYYPDGWQIASNTIPKELPWAISEMAFAINGGTDPQPIQTDLGEVKRTSEKVDVISVSKDFGATWNHPKIPAVEDVLRPLLGKIGTNGGLDLVRV